MRGNRSRYAPFVLGTGALAIGVLLAAFTLAAAAVGEAWTGFAAGALLAFGISLPLSRVGRADAEPTRREALIAVLATWLPVPALGAVPFVVGGPLGALDGLFESMSGFTTTGATVIVDFEGTGRVLMMWRARSRNGSAASASS